MTENKATRSIFYIATLDASGKNSKLLDGNDALKPNMRRNVDYQIVPECTWNTIKDSYDIEIPAGDVYNLFISFRCHGESHKNIYVHGSEKVFDVILTLFVNKMFGLEAFNNLFVVRWNEDAIDPTASFSWFDVEDHNIELTVERKAYNNRHSQEQLGRDSPLLYISTPSQTAKTPCVGLPNFGNTCFMNSAVQCLNNCNSFTKFFLTNRSKLLESKNELLREWVSLISSMNGGNESSIRTFKLAIGEVFPMYKGFEEQDSCEFIINLLDALHEAMKSEEITGHTLNQPTNSCWRNFLKKNDTPVVRTFYGVLRVSFECKSCAFKKYKDDPILAYSLPIPFSDGFNSTVLLVFESTKERTKPPIRIHAPLCSDIASLIAHIKKHFLVAGSILAVEYSKAHPIRILTDTTPMSQVHNRICLYEYTLGTPFFICTLNFKKLFFFKEKFPVDFLISSCDHEADCQTSHSFKFRDSQFKFCSENKRRIFAKLEPYLLQPLTVDELFDLIYPPSIELDSVFNVPHLILYTSRQSQLFGSNMELVTGSTVNDLCTYSIYDCFGDFLKDSVVTAQCEGCLKSTACKMEMSVKVMPKVLFLQLKRFTYNSVEKKLNTFVDFPLTDFFIGGYRYDLVATCNHIEIGMGYGHYVAYVNKNNTWYCCNDSVISKCSVPDKKSAYLLFYERVGK